MSDDHDDAPDIPPALTPKEWRSPLIVFDCCRFAAALSESGLRLTSIDANGNPLEERTINDVADLAALMALCNEVLRRFDDPRAFTREQVRRMREIAKEHSMEFSADPRSDLDEFADALESMLPPSDA